MMVMKMALPQFKSNVSEFDADLNRMGTASAQTLILFRSRTPSTYEQFEFDRFSIADSEYKVIGTLERNIATTSTEDDTSEDTTTVQLEIPRSALEQLAEMRGHRTIEEYMTALVAQDDEALWDEQFAASQDFIVERAKAALADHAAGLTEEFDPEKD